LVSTDKILVHNTCLKPVDLRNGIKGGKEINQGISEILKGRGNPRLNSEGTQKTFQNRNNTPKERKWAGALE